MYLHSRSAIGSAMSVICAVHAALFSLTCSAQTYLQPVQLTSLSDEFIPKDFGSSFELVTPHGKKDLADDGTITDRSALSFGMKGNMPLNRDLKFNNPTPGWMQYNLEQHSINLGGFDAPTYQPDAHGVIPRSVERMYRDADDMQRAPLPKKQ